MSRTSRRIKPGWFLLLGLFLYAVVVTVMLRRDNAALRGYSEESEGGSATLLRQSPREVSAEEGLWFPIPGASLPRDASHLPGSPRPYRRGVSQGFDFYGQDAGIPITFGTPVVAAAAGELMRVDTTYHELEPEGWRQLLQAVAETGADEEQLDRLRGRQIWLRTDDDRIIRYAHLAGIRAGLVVGQRVFRGQVIGYVGNSGTDDGVQGDEGGVRLHFEIWHEGKFFGQDLDSEEVRMSAASLFTGP